MELSNWGNFPVIDAELRSFSDTDTLRNRLHDSDELIPRGMGRCYGDSALNKKVLSTLKFNNILDFNSETGEITCESGVTLAELLDIFIPRGWFLPVTPGTKFVSVGGAIASDVHGKNHHVAGAFSNHIRRMDIMLPDGSIQSCSKEQNPDLFWATCGGMGLTGIILNATFCLIPIESAYIRQQTVKCRNLDEIMDVFEASNDWTYSVAWIDCLSTGKNLGRSIMMRGEFALADELTRHVEKNSVLTPYPKPPKNVPAHFPDFVLNTLSVRAFNYVHYHKAPKGTNETFVDYNEFFYPLDSIHHWNRIYGKRGFTQYQFVLPQENSREGMKEILNTIAQSGQGSFLAVLKQFGEQNDLISFPRHGYTLALDFAINPKLFPLLDQLDERVLHYGGRVYLAKDVRLNEQSFKQGYPNAERFLELKKSFDPDKKLQSLQSKRIGV